MGNFAKIQKIRVESRIRSRYFPSLAQSHYSLKSEFPLYIVILTGMTHMLPLIYIVKNDTYMLPVIYSHSFMSEAYLMNKKIAHKVTWYSHIGGWENATHTCTYILFFYPGNFGYLTSIVNTTE